MPQATAESEFDRVKALLGYPVAERRHDIALDPDAPADLLDRIARALDGRAPHALIDCDDYEVEDLPTLLADVKTRLAEPCEYYPRLSFRRLEVGFAVIDQRIDNQIAIAYNRAFRDAARRIIAPPALSNRDAQGFVALLAQIGPRIALAGAVVVSLFQARYPALYDFYKWYGHRDRPGRRRLPETALGELNHFAHPAGGNATPNRRERDRLLIEAMLADLRHAYGRRPLSRHEWYRCVILLRHSRSRTGAIFRERLRSVLTELEQLGVAAPPLLVVADGRSAEQQAEQQSEPQGREAE